MTDAPELLWQLKADLARKDAEIKRLRAAIVLARALIVQPINIGENDDD